MQRDAEIQYWRVASSRDRFHYRKAKYHKDLNQTESIRHYVVVTSFIILDAYPRLLPYYLLP
jgi:hypothetical protein